MFPPVRSTCVAERSHNGSNCSGYEALSLSLRPRATPTDLLEGISGSQSHSGNVEAVQQQFLAPISHCDGQAEAIARQVVTMYVFHIPAVVASSLIQIRS